MASVWGLTDRGILRRENQDSCAYENKPGVCAWAVVCDGMGGAKAGDIASQLAVETFQRHLTGLKAALPPKGEEELLREAVQDANRAVYRRAQSDQDCYGMGTTLVGALLKENDLWVVNVGDSRAYHITPTQTKRITRDHSVVEDLVARGQLTPDEARHHPQKNLITRALGTGPTVRADLFRQEAKAGDCILLCSDGLVNEVTDQEIHQEIQAGGTPEEICRRLMDRTLQGGAHDNVTIVLFQL
jgi:protein phosphatase